jgi:hypothetical protein
MLTLLVSSIELKGWGLVSCPENDKLFFSLIILMFFTAAFTAIFFLRRLRFHICLSFSGFFCILLARFLKHYFLIFAQTIITALS